MNNNILNEINRNKLKVLENEYVTNIVEKYIQLCKPAKVTVITDSEEDIDYVRELTLQNREEIPLAMEGHTIHFDGYFDQARDRKNTRVLLPEGRELSEAIKTIEREKGLSEITELLDGAMKGKEMLVCFFCLGPNNSKFSIPALQITDSAYVAHSETILYRPGYKYFQQLKGSDKFFHFIHSAGELDERGNSKNICKRRIYIDLEEERVLSVNNQYAGNSVGLKKLALRLAINKADGEGWLCEHMFIMGVHPDEANGRVTYFAGAFPSACGKTSTAMIPGQSIVGDDIAYIKPGEDGVAYAANIEQGIFGIIRDVNPDDDPVIYKALTTPRELIFSNVLIVNGTPYWLGMGEKLPSTGKNFSGEWKKGEIGPNKKEIPAAHKNARYTIRINGLENVDPNLHNPNGVPLSAIIYGGRDADTNPPVVESLSWSHGVFFGASIESETTSATLGQEGVRKHDPMAIIDFLVIPFGKYIDNHLKFGASLKKPPKIFSTNYFLKENDQFLNEIVDKKVWLLWMEGRIHEEYDAIETPIGYIPKYPDLKALFARIFDGRKYTKEEYEKQFSIRITKLIERLDRIEKIYDGENNIPQVFKEHIKQQRKRLNETEQKYQKDVVSPFDLDG